MGVHPFGDPAITDEFAGETVGIDARGSHTYAAEWTPDYVAFYVDGRLVKVVRQSPAYPMQFMLSIYGLDFTLNLFQNILMPTW
jgi:Glycosyl hydrolases family 16